MKKLFLEGIRAPSCPFILLSIISATFLSGQSASAEDISAAIDIDAPANVAHSPGETATLAGKVSLSSDGKPLKKSDGAYTIRAYFPDRTTEVTNQINLDPATFAFSFTTPPLSVSSSNAFSVEIGQDTPDLAKLRSIQAKIDKRIALFDQLLSQMISRNAGKAQLHVLNELLQGLQTLSRNIATHIAQKTDLVARRVYPVQVGNQTAVASVYESIQSGFRFSLSFDFGTQIEGEVSNATASVVRLFERRDFATQNSKKNDGEKVDFFWNGVSVKTNSLEEVPNGTPVSHSLSTGVLTAQNSNILAVKISNKKTGKGKDKGEDEISVSLKLPVARDTVWPIWLAGNSFQNQAPYVQAVAPLSAKIEDSLGKVAQASIAGRIVGTKVDGTAVDLAITNRLQITSLDGEKAYHVTGDVNPIDEGNYKISLTGADKSGNAALPNPLQTSFQIDRTAPVVVLSLTNPVLTNRPNLPFSVNVTDRSPTSTRISVNGVVVAENRADSLISVAATLKEGPNKIEAVSIDAAGNSSSPVVFDQIVLDTVPAVLSNVIPSSGSILGSLVFSASGKSNKPLASVYANGVLLSLSEDKLSFGGTLSVQEEGKYTIRWVATDLVDNTTVLDIPVTVSLKILNGNLVSVMPDPDGSHIWVRGAAAAARAGAEIVVKAGIFNSANTVAAEDGSFALKLDGFTSATVTATDPTIGKSESINVTYGSQEGGTRLSGLVKDSENLPIMGATVGLLGTGLSTKTDSTGLFTFQDPVTGDQRLSVDASTASQPPFPAPQRQYYATNVSISIGVGENNALDRPIYLSYVPSDGSAAEISTQAGGTVSNVHAPGVTLTIPAGVTSLPNGGTTGKISMAVIPAERSTIAPLDIATPSQVIALEPSGTSFSQPVAVTVPNTMDLPPGYEVVVMSQNSSKGIWEIDGAAKVSEDGRSISTKPGMGIRHFSTIYMAPLGPKVSQIGSQSMPGAGTFDGSLSTSVKLPSYRSMGNSISPSLNYKSAWAKPRALVTTFFDIPYEEVSYSGSATGGFLGTFSRKTINESAVASIRPDHINAQFFAGGLTSAPFTFRGLPNRAAISFAIDLKNSDGSYFPTDAYAYQAHYEMYLNQTVIRTRKETKWSWWGNPKVSQATWAETTLLNEAFPSDLIGQIYVQNHASSTVGSGWKIGDAARIVNPSASRIVIEEGTGALSTYALENTITTVFKADGNGYDLTLGSGLRGWPEVSLARSNGLGVDTLHVQTLEETAEGLTFDTRIAGMGKVRSWTYNFGTMRVTERLYNFSIGESAFYVNPQTRKLYVASSNHNALFEKGEKIIGKEAVVSPSFTCNTFPSIVCGTPRTSTVPNCANNSCGAGNSSGTYPQGGYDGDGSLTTAGENRLANSPRGISPGMTENTIVFCDTGNNRVRLLNTDTKTISTIAGNGTLNDNGDGGLATNAGIFHPLHAIYDSIGNLYIASEKGLIRKVDTTGRISTFAGNLNGVFSENILATQVRIRRIGGMAIDQVNGYFYFSDRDLNVVKRIDLQSNLVNTVAGNNSAGYNGDGIAALNASLSGPTSLWVDSDSNLIISDAGNQRIRKVSFQNAASGVLAFSPASGDHSTLQRVNDNSWVRSFRNGSKIFYDQSGFQTALEDRLGLRVTYHYDSDHRLVGVTDAVGRTTDYQYNGNQLANITDPTGNRTSFSYWNGFLAQVNFPDNTLRKFGYNSDGLLASETDERGSTTAYLYNQWGRINKVVRPNLSEVIVNDLGSATAANNYTGGNEGTLQSIGIGEGQVFNEVIDARGTSTKYAVDQSGFISTITDANGKVTVIERDLKGKPTKVTKPDQSTVRFVYDVNSLDQNRVDDLLSITDSSTGVSTSQTYDDFGNVLTQRNGRGYTTQMAYQSSTGLLLSKTNPLGHSVTYSYDSYGRVKTVTDARGKISSYGYDSFENMTSVTDQLGNVTTYTLDVAGNPVTIRNAKNQVSSFEFDVFNRLLSATTPKGEKTTYSYDELGNLLLVKDAMGNETHYRYNALNQMELRKDPLGFETSYAYDPNGNLLQEIDPNGNVKAFKYDLSNRLVRKTLPDNLYNYEYDEFGNLVALENNNSALAFKYDSSNRLTDVTSAGRGALSSAPSVEISYDYDQNGNRTAMQSAAGTTTYEFDPADRLTRIVNPKGENYDFGYDTIHRLTSISRPGSATALAYDDSNFVTGVLHSRGNQTISSLSYGRDVIGNRTQLIMISGDNAGGNRTATSAYGYDGNNQLISASNPETTDASMQSELFAYDSVYNRSSDQNGGYTYGTGAQRLRDDYRFFYFYDSNGNLQSKQQKGMSGETTNYAYSSENQLTGFKVYEAGSSSPVKEVTYAYDALGRRIEKRVVDHRASENVTKSFVRRYGYDGQNIILEYDGDNRVLARFTHSGIVDDDVLSVDITASGVAAELASVAGSHQYLKDAQGTVLDITDSGGTKLQHYLYSAFGKLLGIQDAQANEIGSNPAIATSFGFTGRELDSESGLMYYRARYYDPKLGRFLQQDPHPGRAEIPKSVVNKYAYTANNPLNLRDPSGASWFTDILVGVGLVGLLVIGGAPVLGALSAVGSMAVGAAAASAAMALFQEGSFKDNFTRNFHTNFRVSAGFMAAGAIGAIAFGGGIATAGGNGVTGFVVSNKAIGLSGGLTIGSGSVVTGGLGVYNSLAVHEAGHTLQFIGLSALSGAAGRGLNGAWGSYLGLGILGAVAPTSAGAWWEGTATGIGY